MTNIKSIFELQEFIDEAIDQLVLPLEPKELYEPIAYILKKKEFWKNNFYLNKHILVPRPETELLVEESLDIIAPIQKKKLLEIGEGSG